jgi:YggT family protein
MAEIVVQQQEYHPNMVVSRIINLIVGLIEFALAIRIVLELLGASTSSQFVAWLYSITASLMGPFVGAFPGIYLGYSSFIDVNAILAMIAYAIIGWLVIRILSFVFSSMSSI